jgi:hypothetical protein
VSNRAHELLTLLYRDEDCDGKGLISATGLTTAVINGHVERMKDDIADFSAMQIENSYIAAESRLTRSRDRNFYLKSNVPYLLPSY